MGIIYKVTNKTTNKVYVGKTSTSLNIRRNSHICDAFSNRPNTYFHSAICKYGKEDFTWEVIDKHEDESVLNKLERLYISKYESNNRIYGYNLTEGGEGSPGNKPWLNKTRSKDTVYKIANTIKTRSKGILGFKGAYLKRDRKPETKCWESKINYNGKRKFLGYFIDPVSAGIVTDLVFKEIERGCLV